MDIEEREENEKRIAMLRKNFAGGEAVSWGGGDLYVVVSEDYDLGDIAEDGEGEDRAVLFAVSLENGSPLFEDEHDVVTVSRAKVVI